MKKRAILNASIISVVAMCTQACPPINCVAYDSNMETNNLCIWHTGDIPTTEIRILSCQDYMNQVCDLSQVSKFSWPNVQN